MKDNLVAWNREDNLTVWKMEDNLIAWKMEDNLTAALSWMLMLGLAVLQVTDKHLSNIQDHSFTRQPSSWSFKDFTQAAHNYFYIWQL